MTLVLSIEFIEGDTTNGSYQIRSYEVRSAGNGCCELSETIKSVPFYKFLLNRGKRVDNFLARVGFPFASVDVLA
jgi:hypothetical protein